MSYFKRFLFDAFGGTEGGEVSGSNSLDRDVPRKGATAPLIPPGPELESPGVIYL